MIARRRLFEVAAGAIAAASWPLRAASAEAPPETKRIRIAKTPSVCLAPQYVAEELLQAERFTDVQYRDILGGLPAHGRWARARSTFR